MTAPTAVRDLPVGQRRIIRAWCMYDWANSAFATSGVAAIIPIYFVFLFKDALGESVSFLGLTLTGSSTWSLGVAISTAIVALSSPILGIIADRAALKKTLLGVYAAAGSLFTALAFFSAYTSHPWAWIAGHLHFGEHRLCGEPGLLQLPTPPHCAARSPRRRQQQRIQLRLYRRWIAPSGPPCAERAGSGHGRRRPGNSPVHSLGGRLVVRMGGMDAKGGAGASPSTPLSSG